MSESNGLNQKRIAANIARIVGRQRGAAPSSAEVVCRFLTEAEREALANRDAVRPMDRLLAQPIRCRDGRQG